MIKTLNLGASPRAVQHHYDIGNNFYRLWLDSSLTYSCGYWETSEDSSLLEPAQMQKIDFHIGQAKAHGAERVLDIGCGWGSTLKRLVEVHRVKRAIGLTLSEAQAQWISQFNHPQIETCLESWQNHSPENLYDSIISIEAFEHFAQVTYSNLERVEAYRAFFSRCYEWLKPGGWISLQTSACGNMRHEDFNQFIVNEIFPESCLPRLAEIAEAAERIFEVVAVRNDRADYTRTLHTWIKKLEANRDEAIKIVGEPTVRRYERYLRQSLFSFKVGTSTLLRVTLRRLNRPRN